MTEELLPFCECGKCGLRVTKPGNRFILGHNTRGDNNPAKLSGVGKKISRSKTGIPHTSKAHLAADEAKRGVPHTPDHCAAMSAARKGVPISPHSPAHCAAISKAHTGVPLSPDHCAAISKALHESDGIKARDEAMRGGNDIVNHHIIYDYSDLSKNIMKMTRSMHMRLHRLFQKHGIEIPNINDNQKVYKV